MGIPHHVAIIMDGNRRWAEAQCKPSQFGHQKGVEVAQAIIRAAHDYGVRWLTLFAFSTENWNRTGHEVGGLMAIFRDALAANTATLMDNNIRLRMIGDKRRFDADIIAALDSLSQSLAGNDGLNLTLALNYGGQADLVQATRHIAEAVAQNRLEASQIDEALVKNHLLTAELPPVDLLLRTGREQRVSNFILWDMAYAELAFTETLWPDFTIEEMHAILDEYRHRDRRFGSNAPPNTPPPLAHQQRIAPKLAPRFEAAK